MFTEESLALSKIDAPAVRDVLTYRLRSWQSSGIIKLDQASFADTVPIDKVDNYELSSSNLLYHDQI